MFINVENEFYFGNIIESGYSWFVGYLVNYFRFF